MPNDLIETESYAAFVEKAASLLEEHISSTLSQTGKCILGLSGGKTPLPVYEKLRDRPIDWTNVWVFLTDERYVSPDHADSNQRVLRGALLDHVGLPPDHLLAPDTWKPLPDCVHQYDQALRTLLANGHPDIVTLGLGEDGHIASLFPPLSRDAFEGPCALATHTDHFPVADRISVTMPVLLSTTLPLFLMSGRAKKRTWLKMEKGEDDPLRWPAQAILATGRASIVTDWATKTKEG